LSFREKNNFSLKVACSSGNFYEGKLSKDLYLSSFMHGDIYRSSCYECHYACQNRIGDLTIGDFWGLNRDTLVHKPPQAVSVILQNTNKGNELIQLISNYTILEKRKFVEAVKGNSQLKAPTVKTKYQTKFRAAIGSADFDSAIKKSGLARFFMINRIKASTVLAPLRALKHLLQGLK
jgi:coenzyme F420-reducing hydrogenase beta subunit